MVAVNLPCLHICFSYITTGTRRHTQRVPSANVTVTYSWPRGCLFTMPRFICQQFMSPHGNKCMLSNALPLTTSNSCPHLPIDGGAIRYMSMQSPPLLGAAQPGNGQGGWRVRLTLRGKFRGNPEKYKCISLLKIWKILTSIPTPPHCWELLGLEMAEGVGGLG